MGCFGVLLRRTQAFRLAAYCTPNHQALHTLFPAHHRRLGTRQVVLGNAQLAQKEIHRFNRVNYLISRNVKQLKIWISVKRTVA